MNTAWLQIDVSVLSYGLDLPEGARTLKAEVSDEGRIVGVLVEHEDIPDDAGCVSAVFQRDASGGVQFKEWQVAPTAIFPTPPEAAEYERGFSVALGIVSRWEAERDEALHRIALAKPGEYGFDPFAMRNLARAASGLSASGQDPQGLEAKPASPVPEGETPNA